MTYPAKSGYRDPVTAASYDQQRFTSLWGRFVGAREIQTMLAGLDSLGANAQAVVLDIPAGTCRLSFAALNAGRKVISVDISHPMLATGRSNRGSAKTVNFLGAVVGDVESLPVRDRSVDAVACLRLMGHLPAEQKKRAITEALRVSRLGAVVMFARRTALLKAKRRLLVRLGLRFSSQVWYDETDTAIAALIENAGGSVLRKIDIFGPFAESRLYVIQRINERG
jgi:ubiquinone/menaquinone biosynthesis C-methylase UbiE